MNAPITNYSSTFNDLNNVQLEAAKKKGIVPVKTNRSLKYEDHNLYIVQDCEYFGVDKLTYSHPYVTKNTAKLMVHIGQNFQNFFTKMVIENIRSSSPLCSELMRISRPYAK